MDIPEVAYLEQDTCARIANDLSGAFTWEYVPFPDLTTGTDSDKWMALCLYFDTLAHPEEKPDA